MRIWTWAGAAHPVGNIANWCTTSVVIVATVTGVASATPRDGRPAVIAENALDTRTVRHVRPVDERGAWLLNAGCEYSPTIHAMLDEIDHSDVVAYVRTMPSLPHGLDGRLMFIVTVSGIRYVQMQLKDTNDVSKALMILGHELRHVIEVARDPAIVDSSSMASQYLTKGSVRIQGASLAADTWQAQAAADEVHRELRGRSWALETDFERERLGYQKPTRRASR